MPKIHLVARARTPPGKCETCQAEILPGTPYHHWSFRYGGKHVTCGAHIPRPSQLTQSKLRGAIAAVERAYDEVCKWGILSEGQASFAIKTDAGVEIAPQFPSEEDLLSILDDCRGEIEEVAQEYRDASDAAPNFAEQNDERADMLESAASALEVEFESFGNWEESNYSDGKAPTMEDLESRINDWIEEQRGIAEDALNNAEIEG